MVREYLHVGEECMGVVAAPSAGVKRWMGAALLSAAEV